MAPCTLKQQTSCASSLAVQVKSLRELVTLPLKFPQLFSRYNMKPPRGVLLWGPPGTGKTCLARAAAAEVGVPLFVINGPDVVSQFYGENEAGLQGRCSVLCACACMPTTQTGSKAISHVKVLIDVEQARCLLSQSCLSANACNQADKNPGMISSACVFTVTHGQECQDSGFGW